MTEIEEGDLTFSFPDHLINPANIKLKRRKRLLKAIDPHPAVGDRRRLPPGIPWTVR